jgi:hypothetical protein
MRTSFKTTTLIAAIGMSIATLFFWAEYAMSRWLGMAEITIVSMPERVARHAFFAIQLLSAAIFFLGVYRYPNQLPKRNGWFITVLITTMFILSSESIRILLGLSTHTFYHPIFFNWYKHVVSVLIAGALWFYYIKSGGSPAGTTMRYISLIVGIVFLICFMSYAGLCIGWYFSLLEYYGVTYEISAFIYWFALIVTIVWHIAMLVCKTHQEKDNDDMDIVRKQATWGIRIGITLFTIFVASLMGVVILVGFKDVPDWIEDIIYITLLSIPIVSGVMLIYAGETLRRACDIVNNQQNN